MTQEPRSDRNARTPSHAERARTLASLQRTGALCTLALDPAGFPYGSLVAYGLDGSDPLFLLSELAEHTKNLRCDERASLLISQGGAGEPLARGRLTLLGHCRQLVDAAQVAAARAAYLATQPSAARYLELGDFHFWRLTVESIRYVGGFGRMSWITPQEWAQAEPDPLASHASAIVAHMNQDHAAVMVDYCRQLAHAPETTAASMIGVDRYGFEMSATTAAGPRTIRLAFSHPLSTPDEVRHELVALARISRDRSSRQ